MKYLLYYLGGRLKKFPLKDEFVRIGWNPENDLVLPVETVSGTHAFIKNGPKGIALIDQSSANGTFKNGKRVDCADLLVGDSFCLGEYELFLKEGAEDEFQAPEDL